MDQNILSFMEMQAQLSPGSVAGDVSDSALVLGPARLRENPCGCGCVSVCVYVKSLGGGGGYEIKLQRASSLQNAVQRQTTVKKREEY